MLRMNPQLKRIWQKKRREKRENHMVYHMIRGVAPSSTTHSALISSISRMALDSSWIVIQAHSVSQLAVTIETEELSLPSEAYSTEPRNEVVMIKER